MEMIKTLKNERFYSKEKKAKEIKEIITAIDNVDKEINVLNENVYPYGYPIKMSEIVDSARDWGNYSPMSRSVIISELKGCIDIINNKIKLYNEKDVKVKLLTGNNVGNEIILKESIAKEFVKLGFAALI